MKATSILSLMCPGIGAVTDKQKAEDMARAVNDALAEKISEHPDRFGGFASLAIHDPDKAAKELERCVKKLGFKGVLALLWQNHSGCFSFPIHIRQCGHRFSGS